MERKYVPSFGLLVPHPPSKPPEPKPPTQSHRLPPIRKYYMKEQKGIYSDIITTVKFQVKKHISQCIWLWSGIIKIMQNTVVLWPKLRITGYWLVSYRGPWNPAGPIQPWVQWIQHTKRWDTVLHDIFRQACIISHYIWYARYCTGTI